MTYQVTKCDEKMKQIYIKKYAKPIFIIGNATVTTHELPIDNWASFNKDNLLNSNMSKFMSLAKKNPKKGNRNLRFIQLDLKKPVYACAIGLRAANDFPHFDPSEVSIYTTSESGV